MKTKKQEKIYKYKSERQSNRQIFARLMRKKSERKSIQTTSGTKEWT